MDVTGLTFVINQLGLALAQANARIDELTAQLDAQNAPEKG